MPDYDFVPAFLEPIEDRKVSEMVRDTNRRMARKFKEEMKKKSLDSKRKNAKS